MALIKNTNDTILQDALYRIIDALVTTEIVQPDPVTELTRVKPNFTKLADVITYAPESITLKTLINLGYDEGYPVPVSYSWEYSTQLDKDTWVVMGPQPLTDGVNPNTAIITDDMFKAHIGATTSTSINYRAVCTYAANTEPDSISLPIEIAYIRNANTTPVIEFSKTNIFLNTTVADIVDYADSGFDINVRIGANYLVYSEYVEGVIVPNSFRVGTPVLKQESMIVVGAMTLVDTDKDTLPGTTLPDTARFADFSQDLLLPTTDAVILEYPVTVTDVDGVETTYSVTQYILKMYRGSSVLSLDLNNQIHFVNTNSTGTGYTLAGTVIPQAGGTAAMYDGITPMELVADELVYRIRTGVGTYAASMTVSGLTITINANTGVYELTTTNDASWTSDKVIFDIACTFKNPYTTTTDTVVKPYTISKNKNGQTNVIHRLMLSSEVIYKDSYTSTLAGAHSTMQLWGAKYTGETVTQFGWVKILNDVGGVVVALTDTASAAINLSPASNSTSNYFTAYLYSDAGGTVLVDSEKINVVYKGSSALSLAYSNGSHNVPVTIAGVEDWLGSGGEVKVFEGSTALLLGNNVQYTGYPTAGYFNIDITKVSGDTLTEPTTITGAGTSTATISAWAGNLTQATVYRLTAYIKTAAGVNAVVSTDITLSPSFAGATGTDSTIYWVNNSASVLQQNAAKVYNPTTLTFSGFTSTGAGTATAYSGRFKIYENGSGTASYTSVADEATKVYTPSGTSVTSIKVELYQAGGVTTKLDEETIPVVVDGSSVATTNITNDNSTFSGPLTGYAGITFGSATSAITAYIGSQQLTYAASGNNTFSSVTGTAVGATVAAGSGVSSTYTVPVPTAMSTDTAYVDITTTLRGPTGTTYATIVDRITYSLARKGDVGATGAASTVPGPTAIFAYGVLNRVSLPTAPAVGSGAPTAGAPPAPTLDAAFTSWYATPKEPLLANEWQFQKSGTFDGVSTYVWTSPSYLATFKVGKLEALGVNTGALTVDTAGHIKGGQTAYDTGTGFFLGYSTAAYKFSIGNSAGNKLTWDGSALAVTGSISATSTINGVTASTVTAGAAAGATAVQPAAITGMLTAGSSYALTGVVTPTDTGALKVGSITWSATTGELTGGTGIAITENGIIGALAGVSKFALLANGTATFAGALSAATGSFGDVTAAGTITVGSSGKLISTGTTYGAGGVFLGYDTTDYKFSIMSTELVGITVDIATNTFTYNGHGLTDGRRILFKTGTLGTLNITANTSYYAVNCTTNTFKISGQINPLTAKDITGAGTPTILNSGLKWDSKKLSIINTTFEGAVIAPSNNATAGLILDSDQGWVQSSDTTGANYSYLITPGTTIPGIQVVGVGCLAGMIAASGTGDGVTAFIQDAGTAISGESATGTGVFGESGTTGYGVRASAFGTATGLYCTSTTGTSINASATTGKALVLTSASTVESALIANSSTGKGLTVTSTSGNTINLTATTGRAISATNSSSTNQTMAISNSSSYEAILADSTTGTAIRAGSGTAGSVSSVGIATPLYAIDLFKGGIHFPSTFTDSANTNTLDDYQEIEWTPILGTGTPITLGTRGTISESSTIFFTGSLTATGPVSTDQASGSYTLSATAIETYGRATKIGNRVQFSIAVKIASVTTPPSAGAAIVFGLPWKPSADQACSVYVAGLGGADAYIGNPQGSCRNDSALVSVNMFKNKTHINNMAELFQAGTVIFVSGTYHTTATN
jgi:hypothetical protein